jgi:hypothetical protein
MSARPNDPALLATPKLRQSIYEEKYHAFSPAVIEAARIAKVDLTPQLERLNKISAMCYGMATVMRIVANNTVIEDTYNPNEPKSEAPLSPNAIGHLENMVAEICEHIATDICIAADQLDSKVSA